MKSLWFLLLTLFSETRSMNVAKSVQEVEGKQLEIICSYDAAYKSYIKYWCRGYYKSSCNIVIKTNDISSTDDGRITIEDKPSRHQIKVTIHPLKLQDADWYWCGIQINYGYDDMDYTEIKVAKDECKEHRGICGNYAECISTYGSYHCTCKQGFRTNFPSNKFTKSHCKGQPCQCYPDPTTPQHSFVNLNLTEETQNIFNAIVSTKVNNSAMEMQNVTVLLKKLEQYILDDVLSSLNKSEAKEGKISWEVNKTVITAQSVPLNSSDVEEMLNLTAGSATMSIKKKTVINGISAGFLPVAVLMSLHETGIEAILSGDHLRNNSPSNITYEVNSNVIIATVSSKPKHNLPNPVIFTFQKNKIQYNKAESSKCVFWTTDDNNTSYWSTEGCTLSEEDTNQTHVTCHCFHLSSFAVLTSVSDTFQDEEPLKTISDIGLILSVSCLIICVMTFWLCKSIQNAGTTLLLNLCLCLLVGDLLFLFGISQVGNKMLCKVIAGFLHYLFLACFAWMCLGALQLHLMVQNMKMVKAFRTHVIRRRYMYPVGYGAPAVIVAISASVFPDGYGTDKVCWLSWIKGFQWSFVGPVCCVILINIILFIKTIHMLRQHFSTLNKDVSTIKNTRYGIF
ncbi:adhesion G protein-coupled receptor E3-like [Protopterus annectens]|uniref:adhesion G protein-coupled receptor E3-like n=1 Tax=Protopterus annectens TaxID=7888 RepID=UPI001CF94B1D|nr:adhesion G protein-coupled receptor E3-like [Protopterus annectens]